jgi:hypothetical protein
MVKERDMKIFQTMFIRTPSLLVAMVGAFAWWVGAPASAAPTVSSVQASVNGQVGGTSEVQAQSSSAESQALTGAVTERVTFSGKAVINARVTADPDFRTPDIVVLFIDLSGVSGVGVTSKNKYVTSNKTIVQRRLRPSDSVEVSFPFWRSGTSATGSGPAGTVSFALQFDVNTKSLTGATGTVTGQ